MPRRFATTIALTLCTVAIVLPLVAALLIARHQSMEEAGAQASNIASTIIHRTEAVGEQSAAAYQRLTGLDPSGTCSEAKRAQLRRILLDYDHVQTAAYVSGDRIACSAIGPQVDGMQMGPPAYVSPKGTRVHFPVSIDGSRPFVVLGDGHYATAVSPDSLLVESPSVPDLAQGVFGRSAGKVWAHHGHFDPAWLQQHGKASRTIFYDGHYLVAIEDSQRFDVGAYAAIPRAWLIARLRDLALVLLPVGLALGAAMVGAIVMFARQRASLPALLRAALNRQEFVLYYQPIVELGSNTIAGAEALLRWPANKQIGMRPALFVQAAADCGLTARFTEYVLARVAIDGPRFFSRYPGCYISVNLAPSDLLSGAVVEHLQRLLTTPGIGVHNIVVEVTESSFVDPASANRTIARIHALGIRVAIDDFGTGFSGLSQLTQLRADCLKIDKIFVDAIGTGSVTSEVVLHIIAMARSLKLTLISEGVETHAQAEFLRQHGVAFAQGWLFGKAQPLDELLRPAEPG